MSSDEGAGSGSNPRVLARNTACHQCRKRKLKCDAIKPTCTNCQRHNNRQINASTPKPIECTWDTPRRRRVRQGDGEDDDVGAKRAKMAELEGKIADYERALREQQSTSRAHSPMMYPPREDDHVSRWANIPHDSGMSSEQIWPAKYAGAARLRQPDPQLWERNEMGPDEGMELVWPKWPVDLPSLDVIEHIVEVFFERVPIVPRMIHKPTFKANLQLPPTHWKFPARPLLHSILAVTANHLPIEVVGTRRYFPSGTSTSSIHHPEYDFETSRVQDRYFPTGAFHTADSPLTSSSAFARFQLWHRRKAMSSMSLHLDRGEKFLECIQAQVIVATVDQYNAWWTDLWMLSGSAMRLAIPTRLNESSKLPRDGLMTSANVIMEPTRDPLEQACRDRTWWMVYLLERSVTMSTSWSSSLPDEEITVELPVLQATFDRGWGELDGVQTFHSPDFYSHHPERHMDSLSFYIKAIRLVTEMNAFFRAYSRTPHSVTKYTNDTRVRLLLSQINSFRLSFPPKFRRPTQDLGEGAPDVEALSAIMLTHIMTIMLGEPLITKETWTSDLARMSLTAIRASLSLLYDITATSFDLTLLPDVCAFCWGVASGALCRFIVAAGETGDQVSVSVFKSEVQVFRSVHQPHQPRGADMNSSNRMALQQYAERYPIGQRHLKMLDDTLDAATAGLTEEAIFHCGVKEILDPDYLPGSLKTVPQISALTPSESNALPSSSTSSTKISTFGLPVTPDSAIIEKAKSRGRANSIRVSLSNHIDPGTYSTRYRVEEPGSLLNDRIKYGTSDHAANYINPIVNGPNEAPPNPPTLPFATSTPMPVGNAGVYDPQAYMPDTPSSYQNFMAMAMGLGLSTSGQAVNQDQDAATGAESTGGDFGYGFDINNFSFDIGDFSALLAQPQTEWDGRDGGPSGAGYRP